ncbi:hypothetical protein [Haladaptatus sp. NG-WS-4]
MTDDGDERRSAEQQDEPLADLAAEVETRRNRDREAFEDAFTEVDVEDVDADDLWHDLLAEDSGELVVAAPREESANDRDVRTIPKSTCHSCPHFGDPPKLDCTHDGTDIVAMVDTEHFRVADCPMVVDDVEPLDE